MIFYYININIFVSVMMGINSKLFHIPHNIRGIYVYKYIVIVFNGIINEFLDFG